MATIGYVFYRMSSNFLLFGWAEDIRDREVLRARSRNQVGERTVHADPTGQRCRHPELDANNPMLAKYFTDVEPLQCSTEPDWVCVDDSSVFVCDDALKKHGAVRCTYTFLKRESEFKTVDGTVVTSGSKPIPLESDFFRAKCEADDGDTWENVMAGIRREPTVASRAGWEHVPHDSLGLNVLIWGFDSLSRMTFIRKLPQSYKYLTETLGAVVLKGYNIVGDGTPQAVIPIFTSQTELELPETRKRMGDKANYVNVYPFIWKDFWKNGYVTSYAEDCPSIGTFTYRLTGFDEPPADHYMRTFYVAAEEEYPRHPSLCLGSVPRHKVMMNWVMQFHKTYADKPKFSYSLHSELSHGDYNKIGMVDDDLLGMLKELHETVLLNNTLLIIMSDHGHRFAEIRETQQGKQEERLPIFSFVFPKWFEEKHKVAMKTFRQNAERLSTPFDIYPTLANVLHFKGPGFGNVKDRGISLFKEIPKSRTCQDADIEAHWCACLSWEPVSTDDATVVGASRAVVDYINHLTEYKRTECAALSLQKIAWAGKYIPTEGLLQFKKTADYDGFVPDLSDRTTVDYELYQVKVYVEPGGGHFEASLKHDLNTQRFVLNTTDISRVNKYGKTAECIEQTDEHLRKFCYCAQRAL